MEVKNSLVKREQKQTFSTFLSTDAMKKKINEMVGGEKGQQFVTSIISAVSTNPQLAECENSTIVSAALVGQALNLSPSPQLGQFYMVPFNKTIKNPDGSSYQIKVAQFQIGYKGYIQLAIRSGQYKKLNVLAIKEGELIKYDPLNEDIEVKLIEDEEKREQAKTIGYYAMFEYLNGFRKTLYWSKNKMLAHADKYSQAFSVNATKGKYPKVSFVDFEAGKVAEKDMWQYSSFWYKDFDGMAYKTMLRQLISKWGIMSVDMQKAMESDMAEIKEDGTYEYVDNDFDITEEVSVEEPKQIEQSTQEEQQNFEEEYEDPFLQK